MELIRECCVGGAAAGDSGAGGEQSIAPALTHDAKGISQQLIAITKRYKKGRPCCGRLSGENPDNRSTFER
jgi:hypothetical protein